MRNTRNDHATKHNSLSKNKVQTLSKSKSKDTKMMEKGLTQKEKMVYGINRTKETGGHKERETHTQKRKGGDREKKTGNPEIVRNTSKHRENSTQSIGWRMWGA